MSPNPVADRAVTTLMLSAFVAVAATTAVAAWMLWVVVVQAAIDAGSSLFGMTCT